MNPLSLIISPIIDGVLGRVTELGKAYIAKEISKDQLEAGLEELKTQTAADIEQAAIKAQQAMFGDVQQTVRSTPVMARAYAAILALAALVWVWCILGVGAYRVIAGEAWPYLDQGWAVGSATGLIMFCLGAGFRR